ncbi:uncharacterized protein LOC129566474 [Sitodiplosis mosellana]|uniref:uncharacterized protein LOC129566474 n=1 Tax=Sitodiplosis mosellana TaxID=263140 RepID=UPI002443F1E9|nr:uncharacterized protein LOC129566474 [Sitodiplosis mosellana]
MFTTKYDEKNKVWSGLDIPPTYNSKISVAQVMLNALKTYGSKIAQISDNDGIELSFNEIRQKTIRAAENLLDRGYKPKQVFGLMAKNSHHVAPIVFGSISIGCPVNTLDPSFKKAELIHMLITIKPVLMFCDVGVYDLVSECLAELKNDAKIFTFGGSKGKAEPVEKLLLETHNEDYFVPMEVDGEKETALIICSSGTTGFSKGVCLSHAALLDEMAHLSFTYSSDVMLCFSTLYWITGVITLFKGTMCGATRIITTESYSPELQLHLFEQYKVTWALNASHHLLLMMKNKNFTTTDLSSIRCQFVTGSKVPLHVQSEMSSHLPNGNVSVVYGLSETCGPVSGDYPQPSGRDCVGRLLSGVKIKVIDDQGNRCGPNVDGEVCIKVNYRFLGYYGNQDATDELFDDEGCLMTGDIGHFDSMGYLYIVDRKKDLLKYYGNSISPSEIDAFLIQSPKIKSACIVGIPDEVASDLPAAVIVCADGAHISEQEIFDMVADNFSDHCKLRGGVYFVDSLPSTVSGKVLRRKVKEIAIQLFENGNTELCRS